MTPRLTQSLSLPLSLSPPSLDSCQLPRTPRGLLLSCCQSSTVVLCCFEILRCTWRWRWGAPGAELLRPWALDDHFSSGKKIKLMSNPWAGDSEGACLVTCSPISCLPSIPSFLIILLFYLLGVGHEYQDSFCVSASSTVGSIKAIRIWSE